MQRFNNRGSLSTEYFEKNPLVQKLQFQMNSSQYKVSQQSSPTHLFSRTSFPKVKSLHAIPSPTKEIKGSFSFSNKGNPLSPNGFFSSQVYRSTQNLFDMNTPHLIIQNKQKELNEKEYTSSESEMTSTQMSQRGLKDNIFKNQQSETSSAQIKTTQSLVSSDTLETKRNNQNELFLSRSSFSMKNLDQTSHQNFKLFNDTVSNFSPKRNMKREHNINFPSDQVIYPLKLKNSLQDFELLGRNSEQQSTQLTQKIQQLLPIEESNSFRKRNLKRIDYNEITQGNKSEMCFDRTQSQMVLSKYLNSLNGSLKMLSQSEKKQEKIVQEKSLNREVSRFGVDPHLQEQNIAKKKMMLRKVVNKIKIAKLFQKQGSVVEKHQRFEKLKHANYLEELSKYNQSRSISEIVLIRELYYKVQAIINDLNSVKRASLIISTIRGLTPNIKRIIFNPESSTNFIEKQPQMLKEMKSLDDFEKEFFLQNKQKKGINSQCSLNEETVKELNIFLKYLTDFHERQQSPDFSVIQMQLSEMKDILIDPSKNGIQQINGDKQRKAYFNEVMVAFDTAPSQFTRTSRIFDNLKSREKDLGPFQIVTPFVRQQEKKISNHCDAYCLLE